MKCVNVYLTSFVATGVGLGAASSSVINSLVRHGVDTVGETVIDTISDATPTQGGQITPTSIGTSLLLNAVTEGVSSRTVRAPKADVVTTKPTTGGRLPMTVDNLQMFAEKPKVNLVTSKDNHFNNWLNKGDFDNTVYFAMKNNEPVYTGITKQSLEKRQNQHVKAGKDIDMLVPVYDNLTRNQARAHEQNLIENPIGNSNKLNKINSISPKNKFHDEAIMWAQNNK